DFLYPLLTYDRFGTEHRFQILQLFSFAGGQNQSAQEQKRFTLFPFYFQQRSPNPALNYTALLPFYGHLQNRFVLRDEMKFVMFPLYLQTRKHDIVTDNYIAPFFHLRYGDGLTGWQLWPLLGHEVKIPTTKTNLADELEVTPGHDHWFALWPFYFNQLTGIGSTNAGHEISVLPFYSQFRSPAREATSYLWPFVQVIDDREKKYREWEVPYPFLVFARGEGKTTTRVWPFFGKSHDATQQSDFYLWPIYKYNRLQSEPLDRERTRIFFFLYSDVFQRNTATDKFQRRTDLWPFFTYHRDFNGDERLQILAPIESVLPNQKSIERDWAPLWSLWRAEQSGGETGANSQSLLWNFYRRQANVTAEKISLAFGLLRYQSGVDGAKWRVLFVPLGKAEPAAKYEPLPVPTKSALPPILHPRYDLVPSQ
ncbi:MAG: hypothetical protein RLZZ350_452, partial [Verrucomicrobiota bacterium]